MELTHFEAYFHLFAAGNFAYAGSERFREEIDDSFLQTLPKREAYIDRVTQDISARAEVISAEKGEPIKKAVNKIKAKFKEKTESCKDIASEKHEFIIGFKPMFLITSLYSLSILILAGYEQSMHENTLNNALFLLNLAVTIFNAIIFYRSFGKDYAKAIPSKYPVLLILGINVYALFTNSLRPESIEPFTPLDIRTNIGIALFIASSPYVLHFIKVYLHKNEFEKEIDKIVDQAKNKLDEYNKYLDVDDELNNSNEDI